MNGPATFMANCGHCLWRVEAESQDHCAQAVEDHRHRTGHRYFWWSHEPASE